MTIQEAINLGKPFKRPHWSKYMSVKDDCFMSYTYQMETFHFSIHDLLADDWEIQKTFVEILPDILAGKKVQYGALTTNCMYLSGDGILRFSGSQTAIQLSRIMLEATDWRVVE